MSPGGRPLPVLTDSAVVQQATSRVMAAARSCIKGSNARICRAGLAAKAERDPSLRIDLIVFGIVRAAKVAAREAAGTVRDD